MAKYISRPTRLSPMARICYTKNLYEAQAVSGGAPKFGVRVLFDKKNPEHMKYLKTLAADAASAIAEHWPDESKRPVLALVGNNYDSPIKDGDKAVNKNGRPYYEKEPEVKGHYFIGPRSKNKPAVVDAGNLPIGDQSLVYPGCWAEVAMNVYTYDTPSNGVTIGLNGVRKRKDDERIGGGPPAIDEMFGDPVAGGAEDPFAAGGVTEEKAATGEDPFGSM